MEEAVRCEKCKSTMVYLRIKTKELVCRKCGNIQKVKGGLENE